MYFGALECYSRRRRATAIPSKLNTRFRCVRGFGLFAQNFGSRLAVVDCLMYSKGMIFACMFKATGGLTC